MLELRNNENLIIIKIRFIEIGESRVYMVFYYWFIVVMFIFILFVVLLGFNIIFICLVCKVNCIRRWMMYVVVNWFGEVYLGEYIRIMCMLISVVFVFIIC